MDEALLVIRARHGDEAAFSELFRRHQRRIFQYASYMCGVESADDVVQETFLAVLRQTSRQDTPAGTVAGYLIGIARHVVLKRNRRIPERALDEATTELAASSEPDAFDRLVAKQSVEAIRAAVRSLPEAFREAIVLCELQDLDYSTAAALMQCPIGTVRSRLHRARGLLAAKLRATTSVEAGGVR